MPLLVYTFMSVDLSVTDLAIAGKRRKTQEKKLLVKDQIYCKNSTVGNSRQTQEKLKFAFGTYGLLVRAQSPRKNITIGHNNTTNSRLTLSNYILTEAYFNKGYSSQTLM